MKTRNGFVSNSSSSSFVVLLPHKPKNVEDLRDMMFPMWSWDDVIDDEYVDKTMTIKEVVGRVFKDMIGGQNEEYKDKTISDFQHARIGELDGDPLVGLYYKGWNEVYDKELAMYYDFVKKYGYNSSRDLLKWKKDELYPEYLKRQKETRKAESKWRKIRAKEFKIMYADFRKRYKYHKFQRVLEYGDRIGEYLLEHAEIFRNVPHLKASKH